MSDGRLRTLIERYFNQGYQNVVINEFLNQNHGIIISLSTLKRRLRDYGLKRSHDIDDGKLWDLIQQEITGPGELLGYRAVWHSLRLNHQIHVPRHRVAALLKELNPDGTHQRKSRRLTRRKYTSRGPNFCWHIDGYDKLKPFGFPIHGAIDGYSRKILWLEVVRTNNEPEVPARYYLQSVREINGCPVILRTDCGTENGTMAAMQCYLRQDGNDEFAGGKVHRYGTSPSNQRIECWWSFLKRGRSSWWINLFKDMVDSGLLDIGSELHMECLWFCYHGVLQKDLDDVKMHWNTHRIRPSGHDTVGGVPNVLYYLPQRSGAVECLMQTSKDKIQEMEAQIDDDDDDDDIYNANIYQEYFHFVMENENYFYPNTAAESFELFQKLISIACQ